MLKDSKIVGKCNIKKIPKKLVKIFKVLTEGNEVRKIHGKRNQKTVE